MQNPTQIPQESRWLFPQKLSELCQLHIVHYTTDHILAISILKGTKMLKLHTQDTKKSSNNPDIFNPYNQFYASFFINWKDHYLSLTV